jgi:hypothetical protein
MERHWLVVGSASLLWLGVLGACSEDPEPDRVAETHPATSDETRLVSEKGLALAEARGIRLELAGKSRDERARIGLGAYLVNVAVCDGCHDSPEGLHLAGGIQFVVNDAGDYVYAKNLTPDAITGLRLSEAQFIELMRTGKDFSVPSGEPEQQVLVMPWYNYRWVSTPDLRAMYAYLRALPPVENSVPESDEGEYFSGFEPVPLPERYEEGRQSRELPADSAPDSLSIARGMAIRPLDEPKADELSSSDYALVGRGSYLVNALAHCSDCHTNPARDFDKTSPTYLKIKTERHLGGGFAFNVFPGLAETLGVARTMAPNLKGESNGFFRAEPSDHGRFLAAMTAGWTQARDGSLRTLQWPMPVRNFAWLTPSDLEAIYTYLVTLPVLKGDADIETQPPALFCAADGDCRADGEACDVAMRECAGGRCAGPADCGACQSCLDGHCVAPAPDAPCLFNGI